MFLPEVSLWIHFSVALESLQSDIKWIFCEQDTARRSRLATTSPQVNKCIFFVYILWIFFLGIVAFILCIPWKDKDRSPFFSHHFTFYCKKMLSFCRSQDSKDEIYEWVNFKVKVLEIHTWEYEIFKLRKVEYHLRLSTSKKLKILGACYKNLPVDDWKIIEDELRSRQNLWNQSSKEEFNF